jgi:DNA-binding transcriptional MerR regulator
VTLSPTARSAASRNRTVGLAVADGFRGPQVCKLVGITYRQLDYWARTNLLRPSLADAKGSGTQRVYSYGDLLELKVIKSLLDANVSLQSARTAVEYLRDNLGEEIASANLVLCGDTPLLVREDGEIIDLVRKGQGVLNIVPLSPVVEQLRVAILEMRPTVSAATIPESLRRAANL